MTKTVLSCFVFAGILAAGLLPVSAQISFAAQVTFVAGSQPETTALGDFNLDGDFDAAVTSDAPDKVTIHSNNGAGVLSLTQTVALGSGTSPHFIVAADLDGDLDIDLAVTLKNVNAVTILINNGGTFVPSGVLLPVGLQPRSLIAVNVDGDLDVDLVTSNRDSNTLSLLRNNGNGTFQSAVTIAVGQDPRHLSAGDLDGDGDFDLVVANNKSNSISVLLNGGLGSFASAGALSTGIFDPEGVVLADLDGDHDLDVAVSAHEGTAGLNVVLRFLNLGAGTFTASVSYPVVGQEPGFIEATDVDLDGDLDLATANKATNNVSVLANNGAGTFGAAVLFAVGVGPEHVIARDMNGDQVPDLVAANSDGTTISYLSNLVANGTLTMLNAPLIGTSAALQVSSPNDGGDFYVCGFSFGTAPGMTFPDGRHLPINDDLLLFVSLTANNGFFLNNTAFLAANGTAVVTIVIPPIAGLIGASVYATCAVLNPISSNGFEQSFGPLQITFQ